MCLSIFSAFTLRHDPTLLYAQRGTAQRRISASLRNPCAHHFPLRPLFTLFTPPPPCTQIANVCITLNEYPYIRYYVPAHHGPLGALRPHESTRAAPRPANENSLRWRTNLARGEQARQSEAADAEVVSRVLAFEIQSALDEYKRANPDFPVRFSFFLSCMANAQVRCGGLD